MSKSSNRTKVKWFMLLPVLMSPCSNQERLLSSKGWFINNQEWFINNQEWLINNQEWLINNQEWLINNQEWFFSNQEWFLNNQEWFLNKLNHTHKNLDILTNHRATSNNDVDANVALVETYIDRLCILICMYTC